MKPYLLFGLIPSARPLGDNILLRFSVGREGEGDARECCALCLWSAVVVTTGSLKAAKIDSSYEINADNQLCFTATGTFHFDSTTSSAVLRVHSRRWAGWGTVPTPIYRGMST